VLCDKIYFFVSDTHQGLPIIIYVSENKREWIVSHNKLNDKGDFMSRKKIIMIFNTWLGFLAPKVKRNQTVWNYGCNPKAIKG
jgi:hypothetical protein